MRTVVDYFVATVALILLIPVLVVIAIAIVIDSHGNPLYRAHRAGRFGRLFKMYKFRTMVPNASTLGPVITGDRDPRITRLGTLLRRTKLDELPQFINVLTGDMSIIGPRPEDPQIVALYSDQQRRILSVKPGMTGKVQIEGEESDIIPQDVKADDYYRHHLMDRKLRSDLEYLDNRTVVTDLQILMSTAALVLRALARR